VADDSVAGVRVFCEEHAGSFDAADGWDFRAAAGIDRRAGGVLAG